MHYFNCKIYYHTIGIILLALLIGSCAPSDVITDDRAEESEELIPEKVINKPNWYQADRPVWKQTDTLYVAVSAMAPDSLDARMLGGKTMDASQQETITWIFDQEMEKNNGTGLNGYQKADVLKLFSGTSLASLDDFIQSEKAFYHAEEDIVYFYMKRGFMIEDLKKKIFE